MMSRQSSLVLSMAVGLFGPLSIGCSGSSSGSGSGGHQAQGGSNNQGGSKITGAGGTSAGGTSAGGSSAGGSRTGGTIAGGSSTGGNRTGGTIAGGTIVGGSIVGGTSAGGNRTGGTNAGGSSAGGTGSGGTGSGGNTVGAGGTGAGGVGGTGTAGGTGGVGAGGTSAGTGTSLGDCTNPGTVSNFDDGTMAVRDVAKTGLTGALWDTFSDKTGTIKLAVEDGGSGTCGPKALHISGSGFSDWGGGAEFILNGTFVPGKSQAKPADVSAFVGIRFKAKIGAANKNPVRIQISTPDTEGTTESSGKCDPAVEGDDGCFNHMGRFFWTDSDNPGLSMPMSSSWKAYTFCFDKDLFPKWLPSNLSAEQRRNLAKNFLKFQVDFNKSLDVANNTIDTSQAKLHAIGDAFDLWLDDVEFITDAALCTNYPVTSSWKPISKAGGSCALAPGAAKFHGYIDALYTHWKAKFLSGGKVMMPEQTSDGTTSESQGYGMMLSVAMDDQATFKAIWAETKGKIISGKGVINWSWAKNDGTSATDGDEDIAYALYLADKKGWGTKADADSLASAIMSKDVSGTTIRLGSDYNVGFNPSYFAPLFYRSFAGSWGGVIDTCYGIVGKCQQSNGLIADWCKPDGTPASASELGAQVCGKGMCGDKVYAYEAARAGLRLGQDACWGSGSQASPILTKLLTFFAGKYEGGDSIGAMMAGWLLAQGTPHTASVANQASFVGPLGVAAKSSSAHAKILDNAFRSTLDILESPQFNRVYYSSSLGLISLLEMSGNMPH
jgi:hypothetical protein